MAVLDSLNVVYPSLTLMNPVQSPAVNCGIAFLNLVLNQVSAYTVHMLNLYTCQINTDKLLHQSVRTVRTRIQLSQTWSCVMNEQA